jgi:hypothetical protein
MSLLQFVKANIVSVLVHLIQTTDVGENDYWYNSNGIYVRGWFDDDMDISVVNGLRNEIVIVRNHDSKTWIISLVDGVPTALTINGKPVVLNTINYLPGL